MSEHTPSYLAGHLAPVPDEIEAVGLHVTGVLPTELTGRYFRNGPNPLPGEDSGHWFTGHGMLHGVRLEKGRAAWYRNRWVRTKRLEGAPPIGPDGTRDLAAGAANTSVIEHGGRIFALTETSRPYEMSPELDTLGPCDFGGRLTTGMTAHPKEDPLTGELHLFDYGMRPPFLTYHRLTAAGELATSFPVQVPGPTMMHDLAITPNHIVWLDLPVVFQPELVGRGMPYQWSDHYTARIGLMGKSDPTVQWFDIEPCYVFHIGNAHEDDRGRVTLDAIRYSREAWFSTWSRIGGAPRAEQAARLAVATLHRWTLDPATGTVTEHALDDGNVEFPTVDDRLVGLPNRYLYAVDTHAIVKYDGDHGQIARHELGEDWHAGEAVFVPADDSTGEDEGWLLSIVTHRDPAVASRLLVHDATDLAAEPVATVHLPRRVPAGFHGSWIPDTELHR
ncbi:carotenoid oxygenase family protein [Kitasatospora kifunensis]|uniref:Dioxygenase n=1 Tax=Kitasatospora kifunensis TaxID=58351 RepID=A0A7W7RB37_KITKI|nr:carotenoid oxygenase family protein [Kitasatospora kifunensis]MBB4928742.1 carotenoid cleavage dioxygenase [Kitasatospora kifunensis]